jgi:hypothetical protein
MKDDRPFHRPIHYTVTINLLSIEILFLYGGSVLEAATGARNRVGTENKPNVE